MLFTNKPITNCDNADDTCEENYVKGFQSYNMGLFVLYYETFGYDVDREVKPYYKILLKISPKIF
jgi:hypothetical protein